MPAHKLFTDTKNPDFLASPASSVGGIPRPVAGGADDCVAGGGLPCLSSNNSIQTATGDTPESPAVIDFQRFSTQHKKSACALAWNVEFLAEKYGLERLGFLTLTFAQDIKDPREAQRRFNSLATNVLRSRYADYVRVWERTKKGRIHYHLLVVLPVDIRTGVDFAQLEAGCYTSAGLELRKEWAFWRRTAKEYGFGRTELLPIKSTAEGIARYVGKYISKHISQREEQDKGFRLVEYSRGARQVSTRFAFNSKGSQQWRRKLEVFAAYVSGFKGYCVRFEDFKKELGSQWAFHHREFIAGLPVVGFASDWQDHPPPAPGELPKVTHYPGFMG